jgi:hypothetical protein
VDLVFEHASADSRIVVHDARNVSAWRVEDTDAALRGVVEDRADDREHAVGAQREFRRPCSQMI